MNSPDSQRIDQQTLLNAPRARVWQALTDAREFGAWFMARLEGDFAPGRSIDGHTTYPGYEHVPFHAEIERMDAPQLFSWHWHPHAIDPSVDYSSEGMTHVVFHLEDTPEGGTLLRVTETGFEGVPPARREQAFQMHVQGWAEQLQNIRKYLQA